MLLFLFGILILVLGCSAKEVTKNETEEQEYEMGTTDFTEIIDGEFLETVYPSLEVSGKAYGDFNEGKYHSVTLVSDFNNKGPDLKVEIVVFEYSSKKESLEPYKETISFLSNDSELITRETSEKGEESVFRAESEGIIYTKLFSHYINYGTQIIISSSNKSINTLDLIKGINEAILKEI